MCPLLYTNTTHGDLLSIFNTMFMGLDAEAVNNLQMRKKAAFICVHNSCRSQMAEALGKIYGGDTFESYSAGTETKPEINQDAVRVMRSL